MDKTLYLIVPLLQGFEWFDESLQLSLREKGWPNLTRPESMVMMHVQQNIVRPAEIARSLRLTRQAVHVTIGGLVKRGIFELVDDPEDGRIKIVQLTEMGNAMRHDAQLIVQELTGQLAKRIGKPQVRALRDAFSRDWGDPIVCTVENDQARARPEQPSFPRPMGRPPGRKSRPQD
ncbi:MULTISPECIES: MarR family winged helix-turn-helix transcriptional regulator [Novosphingobium]|uniref:Transcriptional regulator, MarR family n=1 Tax=Novosphingobium mathurense TaxID=428990 RepID=A0A1U6HV99_9SPHN|nr:MULTISPECIES: MarR family winged helix-turn-helix transcriptional regulator [Novosphingobium]CDO37836.1 Transcriptional regulator, MarR family (modular protein) [Novosphingobium sp. KN65.2]SLJ99594.1 transcriptional regulator, MarR family [Novosphingobium mathurense]